MRRSPRRRPRSNCCPVASAWRTTRGPACRSRFPRAAWRPSGITSCATGPVVCSATTASWWCRAMAASRRCRPRPSRSWPVPWAILSRTGCTTTMTTWPARKAWPACRPCCTSRSIRSRKRAWPGSTTRVSAGCCGRRKWPTTTPNSAPTACAPPIAWTCTTAPRTSTTGRWSARRKC
ncbi:hypothetical protein FQZ97_994150 [compost metagenome]